MRAFVSFLATMSNMICHFRFCSACGYLQWAILGGLMLMGAGCGTAFQPVEVWVRERESGCAVVGAEVRIRPLYLIIPEHPLVAGGRSGYLNPFRTDGEGGRTDESGRVRLLAPTDHPFEVVVFRLGKTPQGRVMGRHPKVLGDGVTEWLLLLGGIGEDEVELEVRLEVEGKASKDRGIQWHGGMHDLGDWGSPVYH